MFPLNPIIILQGVPNDLTCSLNGPLQSIKNPIIPLASNDPWNSTSQEKPNAVESFQYLAQRLIKNGIASWRKISAGQGSSFGKGLPHDMSGIQQPLLSKRATKEPMFHRFHRLWATVGATFVNIC